jgi:hypothetical protein
LADDASRDQRDADAARRLRHLSAIEIDLNRVRVQVLGASGPATRVRTRRSDGRLG